RRLSGVCRVVRGPPHDPVWLPSVHDHLLAGVRLEGEAQAVDVPLHLCLQVSGGSTPCSRRQD
ncbi:MAG: hypothetical protein WCP31_10080, partial [Chloroflexales bacterium]